MSTQLSNRVTKVKPSPTLAVSQRAMELKAQGKNIINLGVGEPDLDTPDHIKEAGIKAIQDGATRYTAVDGTPSLKEAIIEKFQRDNQLTYQPNNILASNGAKQCIYNLLQAFINPCDEVIIPAPYWVSYPDMVLLAEGIPVTVPTNIEQHYKITPEQLAKSITAKTRLLILNSPSNPSGIAYSAEELKALADVLLQNPSVFIATDDMYEHILWKQLPFTNILNVCPELKERTVVFNGVSKAYAMTGWRIGYAAGPAPLIAAMKKIQSQSTSSPNAIAQVAATAALTTNQDCVKEMLAVFKRRHQLIYEGLSCINGVQVLPSDGTFYSFPNVAAIIAQHPHISDDIEFAEHLLNEAGLAVVPGTAFGSAGCLRFSFAIADEVLLDALNRLQTLLKAG